MVKYVHHFKTFFSQIEINNIQFFHTFILTLYKGV